MTLRKALAQGKALIPLQGQKFHKFEEHQVANNWNEQ